MHGPSEFFVAWSWGHQERETERPGMECQASVRVWALGWLVALSESASSQRGILRGPVRLQDFWVSGTLKKENIQFLGPQKGHPGAPESLRGRTGSWVYTLTECAAWDYLSWFPRWGEVWRMGRSVWPVGRMGHLQDLHYRNSKRREGRQESGMLTVAEQPHCWA